MTTSSSLTAAGIAFDVGFKRGGALLLSATRAAALLLAASSVPTEPLRCGVRPCIVAGGTDAGGFGTFGYGCGDGGCGHVMDVVLAAWGCLQLMALDVTMPGWNASVATN